jgi:Arc/MetJ family transcription regulator
MKRTNLVLDEKLLEEATRILGLKTYSATVNKALEEAIRIQQVRSIPQAFGKIQWEGDLAEMRQDNPRSPAQGRKKVR